MRWWPGEAKPGDMVRVKLGSIYHYGVYVSENEVIQFGLPPTDPNRKSESVRVLATDVEVFSAGSMVEVAVLDRTEKRKRIPSKKTVETARARIGEGGYNLIHNNCEHFANECVFGIKYSSQEAEAREKWANRPVFDVYVMRLPEECEILPVKCAKRWKEIESVGNERLKREKYCAWKLLSKALDKSAGIDMDKVNFTKHLSGKWTAEGFYFSISHSGGYVCCAYSNRPCGVDLETAEDFARHSKNTENLYDKIALPAEKSGEVNESELLSLWTKKESVFKMLGGRSFSPKKINTAEHNVETVVFGENVYVSAAGEKDMSRYIRYYLADEEIHHIPKSEIKETII